MPNIEVSCANFSLFTNANVFLRFNAFSDGAGFKQVKFESKNVNEFQMKPTKICIAFILKNRQLSSIG